MSTPTPTMHHHHRHRVCNRRWRVVATVAVLAATTVAAIASDDSNVLVPRNLVPPRDVDAYDFTNNIDYWPATSGSVVASYYDPFEDDNDFDAVVINGDYGKFLLRAELEEELKRHEKQQQKLHLDDPDAFTDDDYSRVDLDDYSSYHDASSNIGSQATTFHTANDWNDDSWTDTGDDYVDSDFEYIDEKAMSPGMSSENGIPNKPSNSFGDRLFLRLWNMCQNVNSFSKAMSAFYADYIFAPAKAGVGAAYHSVVDGIEARLPYWEESFATAMLNRMNYTGAAGVVVNYVVLPVLNNHYKVVDRMIVLSSKRVAVLILHLLKVEVKCEIQKLVSAIIPDVPLNDSTSSYHSMPGSWSTDSLFELEKRELGLRPAVCKRLVKFTRNVERRMYVALRIVTINYVTAFYSILPKPMQYTLNTVFLLPPFGQYDYLVGAKFEDFNGWSSHITYAKANLPKDALATLTIDKVGIVSEDEDKCSFLDYGTNDEHIPMLFALRKYLQETEAWFIEMGQPAWYDVYGNVVQTSVRLMYEQRKAFYSSFISVINYYHNMIYSFVNEIMEEKINGVVDCKPQFVQYP